MLYKDKLMTGTQSKAADRYAIDVMEIPSLELMERASACVSDYIIENCRGMRVLVLSGTGNNGADGVCAARRLRESEFDVNLIICGNMSHGTWEFYHQLSEYVRKGGTFSIYSMNTELPETDLLVDALFGIGLNREVAGDYRSLIEKADALQRKITVAVDIPSGISSDTGKQMGAGIHADVTITFGCAKTGMKTGDGSAYTGEVMIRDIGIPAEAYEKAFAEE